MMDRSIEMQWLTLKGKFPKTQNRYIPMRKKHSKGRTHHPWFTKNVKDRIKLKEKGKQLHKDGWQVRKLDRI